MLVLALGVNKKVVNEDDNKLVEVGLTHPIPRSMNTAGALVNPKGITKNS